MIWNHRSTLSDGLIELKIVQTSLTPRPMRKYHFESRSRISMSIFGSVLIFILLYLKKINRVLIQERLKMNAKLKNCLIFFHQ